MDVSEAAVRSLLADGTIVLTEQVRWTPVTDPVVCHGQFGCGHTHRGRVADSGKFAGFSPQWGVCDEISCTCTSLWRLP